MASFGIVSIILSVLAIFVPVFGIMISGLAGILAWLSAGRGTTLGAAAVIINMLNLFFLSPAYMIAAGIEASQRNPEEHKLFTIWAIVLFIQIAAVVVFVFNFFIEKIQLPKLKKKASQKDESLNYEELTGFQIPDEGTNTTDEGPSKVTKVLIHKVHGGRKKDSKFRNEDIDLNEPKRHGKHFNINIDSPKKRKRKEFEQPWMIPVGMILVTVVILIIAKPGLFPFLDYHNIYNATETLSAKTEKETRPKVVAPKQKKYTSKPKHAYKKDHNQNVKNRQQPLQPSEYIDIPSKPLHKKSTHELFDSISLEGKVFSWRDQDGKKFFSNSNLPLKNKTLQVQIGPKNFKPITQIRIIDGEVYIPTTISYNGRTSTLPMILDTGCSRTTIPFKYLNRINVRYSDGFVGRIVNQTLVYDRKAHIDILQVGSNVIKDIIVTGTKSSGHNNAGFLGANYLRKHPFKIDFDKELLVWM